MMRQQGLDIVYFSPLTDALPSHVAAVYLGGGMPELHSAALADNRIFRAGMKKFVEANQSLLLAESVTSPDGVSEKYFSGEQLI